MFVGGVQVLGWTNGITSGWDLLRVGSRPGGITSGWDHVQVGSRPGGIRSGWNRVRVRSRWDHHREPVLFVCPRYLAGEFSHKVFIYPA